MPDFDQRIDPLFIFSNGYQYIMLFQLVQMRHSDFIGLKAFDWKLATEKMQISIDVTENHLPTPTGTGFYTDVLK